MMKKIVAIITITMLFAACSKDTDNVSKMVTVSYPEVTLKGESVVNLQVGAAYTDAGATVKDDITGQTSDLTPVSSNIDTSAPGLYLVQFLAANANGYETSETRVVTVTAVNDPVDYSGNYVRSNGQICVITKISNGVYKLQNPGGAPGADDVIIYMVETDAATFVAPAQPSVVGSFALLGIKLTGSGASWTVDNAGYGTQVRTFVKQ